MMIGITAVVGIAVLMKPRSKYVFLITFFFLWLCMAGTYGNADEEIYLSRYNNIEGWALNTELLYGAIISFARKIGLSFEVYKACITLIQLLLMSSTVKKFAKYPSLVLYLYFWFPFLLDVAQMRNALAMAIMIFGIRYLLESNSQEKPKKFFDIYDYKYLACIIAAMLVHTSAILWILLLLAKKISTKKTIVFMLICNGAVLTIFNNQMLYRILVFLGVSPRIMAYVSIEYQNSEWKHIGSPLLITIVTFVFMMLIYVYLNKNKKNIPIIKLEFYKKINIILLSMIALIITVTGEVYRMQAGVSIINYIIVSNYCGDFYGLRGEFFKIRKKDAVVLSILISYVILAMWLMEIRYGVWEVIFLPVFRNNRFIDMIFGMN